MPRQDKKLIPDSVRPYVYYEESGIVLLHGDCLEILPQLGHTVQCCVTSPPYWGLRDYGVKGQFGMEETPEEYTARMTDVFSAVSDILYPDGTLWLNLGDIYNSPTPGARDPERWPKQSRNNHQTDKRRVVGLKPKDLVGIPWRVAFALQADGWYLRSDIIWNKPNPMPESVTDRPTKAHEYIFLMSKSERYYYDHEAIKEPVTGTAHARRGYKTPDGWDTSRGNGGHGSFHKEGREKGKRPGVGPKSAPAGSGIKNNDSFAAAVVDLVDTRNKRTVWTVPTRPYPGTHFATFPPELIEPCILAGTKEGDIVLDPFSGSGTVGHVCKKHRRRYIGIELNEEYLKLSPDRIGRQPGDKILHTKIELKNKGFFY